MCLDMRKTLLLLFTFISLNVFSQDLTVTPDPVVLTLGQEVVDKKVDMTITNNLGRDAEFYWSIDREGVPVEWEFYLCDVNLCYTTAIQSCPCSKPNLLGPNESGTLMMHIISNGVVGTGAINLAILSECDGTTSVLDVPITFEVEITSSTEFAEINDDISLYPNPALDVINLIEDEDVKQIEFYNIVGKKLKSYDHIKGQSHDVSEFSKGIYLVRLLNKSNNILKVLRMTKK